MAVLPQLKYPANPPAVGDPETIGYRSELYFLMILISIAAAIAATVFGRRLALRYGGWNAALIAGTAFIAPSAAQGHAREQPVDAAKMPTSGEVTGDVMLWDAGTEVNEAPGAGPNQARPGRPQPTPARTRMAWFVRSATASPIHS